MRAGWRRRHRSVRRAAAVAPWRRGALAMGGVVLAVVVLAVVLVGGGADGERAADGRTAVELSPGAQSPGAQVVAGDTAGPTVAPGGAPVAGAVRSSRARGEATLSSGAAPTVEELLEQGLALAGASPVQLAIRGTAAGESVRCAWRGDRADGGAAGAGDPVLAAAGGG